jgi:hypothetical protein
LSDPRTDSTQLLGTALILNDRIIRCQEARSRFCLISLLVCAAKQLSQQPNVGNAEPTGFRSTVTGDWLFSFSQSERSVGPSLAALLSPRLYPDNDFFDLPWTPRTTPRRIARIYASAANTSRQSKSLDWNRFASTSATGTLNVCGIVRRRLFLPGLDCSQQT